MQQTEVCETCGRATRAKSLSEALRITDRRGKVVMGASLVMAIGMMMPVVAPISGDQWPSSWHMWVVGGIGAVTLGAWGMLLWGACQHRISRQTLKTGVAAVSVGTGLGTAALLLVAALGKFTLDAPVGLWIGAAAVGGIFATSAVVVGRSIEDDYDAATTTMRAAAA